MASDAASICSFARVRWQAYSYPCTLTVLSTLANPSYHNHFGSSMHLYTNLVTLQNEAIKLGMPNGGAEI